MTATLAASQLRQRRGGQLHQRDFRLLWTGETTSSLGSSVTSVALPLVALTMLHAGVVAVSLLTAAAWLPWLIIGLPAGAWVDRMPRRPVMMGCDAASLLLFASIPIAAWAGALTMTHLLAVALLTGVAKVFFSTAYRAYLPSLVGENDLVEGNSRLQGSESAAQVAGPGLGGMLAQAFGAANGLLADAISFLVSALCLHGIQTPEQRIEVPRRALRQEIADGMCFVANDRLLRVFMVFGAAANLVLTGYGAITVVFLVRGVGLSSGAAGTLIAAASTGGVLGALVAPRLARTFGSARALLLCKVGTTPLGLLIPLTGSGWRLGFFLIGSIGVVGGVVAGNVIWGGFMQSYCPTRLMGRITTSMQVVNFGTIPVGAILGGLLSDALGFRTALWILFGSFVLASLILLAAPIRHQRDLATRRTRPSVPAGTIRG